jgi:prophage DNA circulation protein
VTENQSVDQTTMNVAPVTESLDSPTNGPNEPVQAERVEDLPEWAQKHIRDLRKENAQRRVDLKSLEQQQQTMQETLDQLAKTTQASKQDEPEAKKETKATDDSKDTPDVFSAIEELRQEMLSKLQATSLENTRLRVGLELSIPEALASRLQGTTEEEIREDAQQLLEVVRGFAVPVDPIPPASKETKTNVPTSPSSTDSKKALTEQQRREIYFGGGPGNSGLFNAESGGVILNE